MESIIVFLLGLILGLLFSVYEKKVYFNSNAYKIEKDRNFLPEFQVVAAEKCSDAEHKTICKYTVKNCFFAKKGNKDFKYQTFYFFDEVGKYAIGQILTLHGT